MIRISEKAKCCGCTACANICPQKCITMCPDNEGFLYPQIDEEKCVDCHLCEHVCPILNHQPIKTDKLPKAFAVRTTDDKVLMESTSGGFTTPLAEWVFSRGGVIWCATYDERNRVIHKRFTGFDQDFAKSRGSKYVQSDLGFSYREIEKELKAGRLVCFVGTTCQVYGLVSYLRKPYENLVTVDLVCHGTPSPKLWEKYVEYQEEKYKSKIVKVNFRNKTYGYHSGTMLLEFENGRKYTGSARVDYMLNSFFSEISSRPSCYECPFKQINRVSDFTIFDCWHAGDLIENIEDDDRGYTNVLLQTEKAKKVLFELRHIDAYEIECELAIRTDGIMIEHSAIANSKRKSFYEGIDTRKFNSFAHDKLNISVPDRIVERSKTLVYRLGLLKIVKRLRSGE